MEQQNKNSFFVLGLPRSRTSWMANFLTYTDTFCYHEALRMCKSISDLKNLLNNHDEKYVGNSDCALVPFIDELLDEFPNSKLLLIERKPNDVVESLLNFQLTDNYEKTERWINMLQKKIKYIKKNYPVKCVKLNEINDINVCKEIWEYLLPQLPFNEQRWYFLDDLYVNVMMGKTFFKTQKDSLHIKFNKIIIDN